MCALDADANPPTASPVNFVSSTGAVLVAPADPLPGLTAADCALASISITYQGAITSPRPHSALEGTNFTVDAAEAGRVQVGDVINVDGCNQDLPVTAVVGSTVQTGALPVGCTGQGSFVVRAAGTAPYVVAGDPRGYIGRTSAGTVFSSALVSFTIANTTGALGTDPGHRDFRYIVSLAGSLTPYVVGIDPQTGFGFNVAGGVALHEGQNAAFVSYPSGQRVLELSPGTITAGTNSASVASTKIKSYR
jgi:hypothetical protein